MDRQQAEGQVQLNARWALSQLPPAERIACAMALRQWFLEYANEQGEAEEKLPMARVELPTRRHPRDDR